MIDNIAYAIATVLNTKLVRNYPHYCNQIQVAVNYLPFYTLLTVPNPTGFWSSKTSVTCLKGHFHGSLVFTFQNQRLIINKVNYTKALVNKIPIEKKKKICRQAKCLGMICKISSNEWQQINNIVYARTTVRVDSVEYETRQK